MKEKYIAEIIQLLNSMNESQLSRLVEFTHLASDLTESQLLYILTFANKIFGSH